MMQDSQRVHLADALSAYFPNTKQQLGGTDARLLLQDLGNGILFVTLPLFLTRHILIYLCDLCALPSYA